MHIYFEVFTILHIVTSKIEHMDMADSNILFLYERQAKKCWKNRWESTNARWEL